MTIRPPDDGLRPGLPPPQFGMATLLWAMAVLCVVFAVLGAAGPVAALVVVFFCIAVFAHVAGNALGTKLKENGSRRAAKPTPRDRSADLSHEHYAPATNLGEKASLGITTFITTLVGMTLGGVVGGGLLTVFNWEKIVWPSIAVAAIASGVLGGLAGFLASSFVHVMIEAHVQAWRHGRRG